MTELALLDFAGFVLVKQEKVLAARQLLLPGLDLFLAGERVGLEDAVDNRGEPVVCDVELGGASEAPCGEGSIVSVFFGLGGNGELGNFGRGLIADKGLAGAADVEGQRVSLEAAMELAVQSVSRATAVEALQTDIETGRLVLGG